MIRKFLIVLTIIGFLIGLGIFLYPHISSWLIDCEIEEALNEFEANGALAQSKEQDQLYQVMKAYNENLYSTGQTNISDAWTFAQEEFKLNDYDYKNDVVATIEIAKMNISMPIYLGATKENMSKGIVNLGNTSLPIGGKNSNCVLAGHRGYRGAPFFRDIEDLQIGDEVIIRNYWDELKYKVSQIKVIYPSDSDQVLIQADKDMVTLITCHPYRNNYQRYVVYCSKDEEFNSGGITTQEENKIISSKEDIATERNLPYLLAGSLAIVIVIVIIYKKRK